METCPNCGQPGRPGARFCTSCGFRLPERPVEPEPSPLSRSPFATTSTVAASWWPSANPSSDPPPSVFPDLAPPAPTTPDSGSGSDVIALGKASESDAGAGTESPAELAAEPAAPADAPAPAFPVWPSFPSYGSEASASANAWSSSSASPTGSASGDEDLAAAVEAMAGPGESVAVVPEPTLAAEPTPEPEPVIEEESAPVVFAAPSPTTTGTPSPFAWREDPSAISELLSPPSPAAAAVADGDGDAALARAVSLVDELRSLLPSLAAATATATVEPDTSDREGLVVALTRARDEVTEPQTGLDALMVVVKTAQDRPRDIDVMLDLIRHADAIAALKTGYERALTAIDDTIDALKAE